MNDVNNVGSVLDGVLTGKFLGSERQNGGPHGKKSRNVYVCRHQEFYSRVWSS